MSNELIPIKTNEQLEPIVSGRDLHEFLEVETRYTDWLKRQLEYGFVENTDYTAVNELTQKREGSRLVKRELENHALKLDMAKEISMIQRNEKGKMARQYFISIEKEYNSPAKIMARALKIADLTINNLTLENNQQKQIIGELKPKADYTDTILKNKGLVTITQIAKDYGMSGQAMNDLLHSLKIQYKQSNQWLLYKEHHGKGYTHSETIDIVRSSGMTDIKMNTKWTQKGRLFLYELLKENGILPNIEKEDKQ